MLQFCLEILDSRSSWDTFLVDPKGPLYCSILSVVSGVLGRD